MLPVFFIFLVCSEELALAQQPDTKVTLGIKPDYWYTFDGDGVKIKAVINGKVAQKAGMKSGDIILAFDDRKIKDIFKYRDMLSEYNPGDQVKVKVQRHREVLYFDVQLE